MLPKLELHRGSLMENSSGAELDIRQSGRGTGRGSRKTGEERRSKNNTQVRMHG